MQTNSVLREWGYTKPEAGSLPVTSSAVCRSRVHGCRFPLLRRSSRLASHTLRACNGHECTFEIRVSLPGVNIDINTISGRPYENASHLSETSILSGFDA